MGRKRQLKPSYIPPREQRELRDLTRYRRKLIQSIAANKNRIDRILEDCKVKLSSVMSGTDGVVATKIIDRLIDGRQITMADIDEVYLDEILWHDFRRIRNAGPKLWEEFTSKRDKYLYDRRQ